MPLKGAFFYELNAFEHTSRVEQLGIKIFPFLLLDGKIIKIGIPDKKELKSMLEYRLVSQISSNNINGG